MDDQPAAKEKPTTSGRPYSSQQLRIRLDQFMQYLYTMAIVQHILGMYNQLKHSSENMNQTFSRIENGVKMTYRRSLDFYEQYCEKYIDNACANMNSGNAKHILEAILTFGIGAIILMAQLSITVFIATVNMLLNAVTSGREAVNQASATITNAQAAAQQMASDISGKVQDISHASAEKVGQQANRLVDQANRVATSTLGVAPESGGADKTLSERLRDLGYRITENLKDRAQGDAVNSVYSEMHSIMERLGNSLSLVDMVRENRAWITGKFGELQTSLADLKTSLEREAERLKENPEEALMNYLRQNSTLLSQQLHILKQSAGQVLNEPGKNKLDAVTSYLEELDKNLGEAHDIHEVKDDVLKGAHDRLLDLIQWTTNHLAEQQKRNTEGTNEHKHEEGDSSHVNGVHTEDIRLLDEKHND